MKDKIYTFAIILIGTLGISAFYFIDNKTHSYSIFLISVLMVLGLMYSSRKYRLKLELIKDSFDDIKTYSLPKTKEMVKFTGLVVIIAIFIGVMVFLIDNIIRFLISL